MDKVISTLNDYDSLSINGIMAKLDISKQRLRNCLKFLLINGDVAKEGSKYYKTPKVWNPDMEYSKRITETRYNELDRMNHFIATDQCYMKLVANELNDESASNCQKCSNCIGKEIFKSKPHHETIIEATNYIKKDHYTLEPRKKWPVGIKHNDKNKIDEMYRCEKGLALSNYGDAGWGRVVSYNKYRDDYFCDDLVRASLALLKEKITNNEITWVTSISSLRRPELVKSFAERLAEALNLPYYDSIIKVYNSKQQKELHNSHMQYKNAWESFEVTDIQSGNVLLVDDMVDSRWTFTVCGYKLIREGSGKVFPFALANTVGSGGND